MMHRPKKDLYHDLTQHERDIDELEQKITRALRDEKITTSVREKIHEDIEILEQKIEELKGDPLKKRFNARRAEKEAELESQKERLLDLGSQVEGLIATQKALSDKKNDIKNHMDQIDKRLAELDETLKEDVEKIKKEYTDKEKKAEQALAEKLKVSKEEINKHYSGSIDKCKAQQSVATKKLAMIEAEYHQKVKEAESEAKRHKEKIGTLDKEEISVIDRALKDQNEMVTKLSSELKTASQKEKSDNKKSFWESFSDPNKKTKEALAKAEALVLALQKRRDEWILKQSELEKIDSHLKQKTKSLKESKDTSSKELTQSISILGQTLQSLEREKEKALLEVEAKAKLDLEESSRSIKSEAESALSYKTAQFEKEKHLLEEQRGRQEEDLKSIPKKIEEIDIQVDRKKSQSTVLKATLQATQTALNDLDQRLKGYEERLHSIRGQYKNISNKALENDASLRIENIKRVIHIIFPHQNSLPSSVREQLHKIQGVNVKEYCHAETNIKAIGSKAAHAPHFSRAKKTQQYYDLFKKSNNLDKLLEEIVISAEDAKIKLTQIARYIEETQFSVKGKGFFGGARITVNGKTKAVPHHVAAQYRRIQSALDGKNQNEDCVSAYKDAVLIGRYAALHPHRDRPDATQQYYKLFLKENESQLEQILGKSGIKQVPRRSKPASSAS